MRVHRAFLYAGVFLVALGGVFVVAEAWGVNTAGVLDALRLWPLAIVAIGLAIALRRTPLGFPTGVVAAALPALVLGGAIVVAPGLPMDYCGTPGEPGGVVTRTGSFAGPANVSVHTGCGSLNVVTSPGNAWRLDAGTSARPPRVESTSSWLSIDSTGPKGWAPFDDGRDSWTLTLPTSEVNGLTLDISAGRGTVSLAGADIGRLEVMANAADVSVDARTASLSDLSAEVNLGRLSIQLPAQHDLVGSLHVSLGSLEVCTPPGLGLRVTSEAFAGAVRVGGVQQAGTVWESPDFDTAEHRASLDVNASLGEVQINPIGGCR